MVKFSRHMLKELSCHCLVSKVRRPSSDVAGEVSGPEAAAPFRFALLRLRDQQTASNQQIEIFGKC